VSFAAAHDRILAAARLAAPRLGTTVVIAVDGRSGAGKTTIASAVAEAIDARVVALEDLYGGWDGLEAGIARLVSAVLRPLAAGAQASVPRYDWTAKNWATPWPLPVPERLVVEGVGAGARTVAPYTSLLVWVELAASARRERALARDGKLYAPHWRRWAAQEDAYIERERPRKRADCLIEMAAEDPPG